MLNSGIIVLLATNPMSTKYAAYHDLDVKCALPPQKRSLVECFVQMTAPTIGGGQMKRIGSNRSLLS